MPDPFKSLTDDIILEFVPAGSRVLDLGCGDGRLLKRLIDEYRSDVIGIELDLAEVRSAVAQGVPVLQGDLDHGLPEFPDDSFDLAVLSQTLQEVKDPQHLLEEMLRVAKQALVVVPNFGHWWVRWQVLLHGRAPVTSSLPYEWYNTPNRHFMSMKDFRDLADQVGARITREMPLIRGRSLGSTFAANLRADSALYILDRRPGATT